MKLYHGGIIAIEKPRIIRSDVGRDFGFAFYTTDIKEQAERWAWRRMLAAKRNGNANAAAVVSVFNYDDTGARQELSFLDFPDTSMAWLELVIDCRSERNHSHGYDVVTGKIANDNVGETVAYVMAGVMRKEDALERLRFQKINNQLAFCSERALLYLKYDSHFTVTEAPHD